MLEFQYVPYSWELGNGLRPICLPLFSGGGGALICCAAHAKDNANPLI